MKKFETPKMIISVFESENVVTTSGGSTPTAVELATADSVYIDGTAGTLQVDLW